VGLATLTTPGGHARFGVVATAASAVLYTAVVLLGVKAASPSALGADDDRGSSVVLIRPHDSAAPGPEQKLPQASLGPARHQHKLTPRVKHEIRATSPTVVAQPTERPTEAPLTPAAQPSATPLPEATPAAKQKSVPPTQTTQPEPILEVTPPKLPPPAPDLPLPSVTVPTPPVTLPQTPTLPVQLPGVSELPH
jgi:hypothetical protein